jgi:hypothetical protein
MIIVQMRKKAEPKAKQKTLTELRYEFVTHLGNSERSRLKAGRVLLEMRRRVEAGEDGEISWWDWYAKNLGPSQRSRKDAQKLLRIAEANDPEAAEDDARKRNAEHQAKHRAKVGAYVSAEQLERETRVKAYIERQEQERVKKELQNHPRHVGDFTDAIKAYEEAGSAFEKAVTVAITAISKFSPEAKSFVIHRLVKEDAKRHALIDKLIAAFTTGKQDNAA